MRRVLVIGCSGAGKSTFSTELAARTGLPLISLDAAFWQPGWVEAPTLEWRTKVAALVAADSWIMDGTFVGTLDLRLPRADTVIWFDLPRHLCLTRALWRVVTTYGRVRPEMAAGCPERIDFGFLRYIWTFDAQFRPRIVNALAAYTPELAPVRIRHDADIRRILDTAERDPSLKAL